MIKISALVSAYYASDFLAERLRNLAVLLPPPEIIVVCKSRSLEEEISQKYLDRRPSIFEIHTTKDIPTLYKAWNIALTWAKGEYLTSANCDDHTYPNGLNAMCRYLDAHPDIDLVYGDCDILFNGIIQTWKRGESDLLNGINRVGVMPMWRKSLHDRFGMFEETLEVSGDFEFWRRCVLGGAKIAHIDTTVGLYWKRSNSLENRNKATMRKEDRRIKNA